MSRSDSPRTQPEMTSFQRVGPGDTGAEERRAEPFVGVARFCGATTRPGVWSS